MMDALRVFLRVLYATFSISLLARIVLQYFQRKLLLLKIKRYFIGKCKYEPTYP